MFSLEGVFLTFKYLFKFAFTYISLLLSNVGALFFIKINKHTPLKLGSISLFVPEVRALCLLF